VILAVAWVTVSSLATAGTTLVLAFATFASVRSANRSARAAERSLLAGLLPMLIPSRPDDPPQKVGFVDDRWFSVAGGRGVVEIDGDAIYLAMAIRNVGNGIAVLHAWHLYSDRRSATAEHAAVEGFHRLTRDLYIAPGEVGFWQGAFRDPAAPEFAAARETLSAGQTLNLELLYGDHEGGQRTITRFALAPREGGDWIASVVRHWYLDRPNPR
jgi:hypothetical protein